VLELASKVVQMSFILESSNVSLTLSFFWLSFVTLALVVSLDLSCTFCALKLLWSSFYVAICFWMLHFSVYHLCILFCSVGSQNDTVLLPIVLGWFYVLNS
jgi:hypothetical protein